MKTRYKILLIIAISAIAYIFNHTVMYGICNFIIDDVEHFCFNFWFQDTSIYLTNHQWDTGTGIKSWSGTAEIYQLTLYETLRENSGFIFWHMILPTFAILLIYQRDRLKK